MQAKSAENDYWQNATQEEKENFIARIGFDSQKIK